jgi:hypothetical protein
MLWERFSDWMEEHRGDLAGFAAKEGFLSIHPGVDGGQPVLLASRTQPQRPYAPAREATPKPAHRSGGSEDRHDGGSPHRERRRKARK